jgi:hypothetical protein
MLTLGDTVLLICMRTRHTLQNTKFLEESVEVVILTTPVGLNTDFCFEKTFNMYLELQKGIKHIIFMLNKIKPSKATININKTDIVIMSTGRRLSMTSYIRKH